MGSKVTRVLRLSQKGRQSIIFEQVCSSLDLSPALGMSQVIWGLTFLIWKMGTYLYPCHPASPEDSHGGLGA